MAGYKATIISTLVDNQATKQRFNGYKATIISILVDS